MLFARAVIGYQYKFNKCLRDFFSKLCLFVFNKKLPQGLSIVLPAPKMLQIERENENVRNVKDLIDMLKDYGIPSDFLVKKYLSFDWEEIEKYKADQSISNILVAPPEEEVM